MGTVGGWASAAAVARQDEVRRRTADLTGSDLVGEIERLAERNREIHEHECLNLNPATNVVPRRAEALLSSGLSSRPSLGHPGEKYEMGLEAIEEIEIVAADLACRVFRARFAEVRIASGAMANLYGFLATSGPGDTIVAPPAAIAGHVTHHDAGVAGLLGLRIVDAPVDAERYTIDVDALATLVRRERPTLITVGGSLNLTHHPVAAIREIADEVGAKVLFDAAHLSGPIAGGAWPNPLEAGAHLLTLSTYKSLAGPAAGLLLTDDEELAERVDATAYPGMTANFDVGATAALAVTLLGWLHDGDAYARAMCDAATALAAAADDNGLPVVTTPDGPTRSHAFALDAQRWGGGHETALRLRRANLLTSAIGLPSGDGHGLRLGTSELVRFGMTAGDMPEVAGLIEAALTGEPEGVAPHVTALRGRFPDLHFLDA